MVRVDSSGVAAKDELLKYVATLLTLIALAKMLVDNSVYVAYHLDPESLDESDVKVKTIIDEIRKIEQGSDDSQRVLESFVKYGTLSRSLHNGVHGLIKYVTWMDGKYPLLVSSLGFECRKGEILMQMFEALPGSAEEGNFNIWCTVVKQEKAINAENWDKVFEFQGEVRG